MLKNIFLFSFGKFVCFFLICIIYFKKVNKKEIILFFPV